MGKLQTPTMVMPGYNWTVWTAGETLNDNTVHYSRAWRNEPFTEVTVMVKCQEQITAAGIPGNLQLWIELSPFPTPTPVRDDWPEEAFTSWFTYAPIGGTAPILPGAANIPLAPTIVVPVGVHLTYQNVMLNYTTHQTFARLCAWDATGATLTTDRWWLQAFMTARGD